MRAIVAAIVLFLALTVAASPRLSASGVSSGGNATALQGRPVSATAPTTTYVLEWDGAKWTPTAGGGGGGSQTLAQVLTTGNAIGSGQFMTVPNAGQNLAESLDGTAFFFLGSAATYGAGMQDTLGDELILNNGAINIQDAAGDYIYAAGGISFVTAPGSNDSMNFESASGIYWQVGDGNSNVGNEIVLEYQSSTLTSLRPNNDGQLGLGVNNKGLGAVWFNGPINVKSTTTATVGNVEIDQPSGRVNIAASGTSITVTDSFCTTASHVFAVASTNDATARVTNVVPGTGSFTINTVACTAQTSFDFLVINQ